MSHLIRMPTATARDPVKLQDWRRGIAGDDPRSCGLHFAKQF
jgi:hypothetical protein